MPDLRHLLPFIIIGGSFTLVGSILYGAWMLGRYRGREDRAPAEIGNLEARLFRLEESMNDMTGALERLEAAHRLTTRLLTDPQPEPQRVARRSVTPH